MEEALSSQRAGLESKAPNAALAQVEATVGALTKRVHCELTGARWLSRSGATGKGGWVPWEVRSCIAFCYSFHGAHQDDRRSCG
jgi:hypothetical protein